ncbi:MAG: type II toxin-antitoxin system RelE/ParE family toxin [Gammaproteobacteria bacterium]|nr:type II toxin-antitoxin system RelE/ParE family toxin [Gammaproteobacteria bacterium]
MNQRFYRLRIPDEAARLIRGLHPHLKKKLRASLQTILSDPSSGKALKEELAGLWSLRVSRFRIIYRMRGAQQIEIIAVGPRERIYEETFKLIRKERRR